MHFISKQNINMSIYFSLLLGLMPFSFIAGNMIININVILIILSSFVFLRKELFEIKYITIDKILLAYFVLILITGFINDLYFYKNNIGNNFFITTIKSILFLKYLLLYFSLRLLIIKDIINLKLFFIFCSLATIFVSLDIFYQFFFGKDIFGFEADFSSRKLSGPFGDELIAGSFIQRFSIFAFFLLPFFYPEKSRAISK